MSRPIFALSLLFSGVGSVEEWGYSEKLRVWRQTSGAEGEGRAALRRSETSRSQMDGF